MGSDTDWPVMKAAADALSEFGIGSEAKVISAHRTPRDLEQYVSSARERGLRALICGAGGAAHRGHDVDGKLRDSGGPC